MLGGKRDSDGCMQKATCVQRQLVDLCRERVMLLNQVLKRCPLASGRAAAVEWESERELLGGKLGRAWSQNSIKICLKHGREHAKRATSLEKK